MTKKGPAIKPSSSFAVQGLRLLVLFSLLAFAPSAQGQVSFFSPPTYAGGAPLFVADFNGDGKPDILSGAGGAMNLGNGNGTFIRGMTVSGGALAVADFNGDGKPDVLQQGTGTLLVLLGNGAGTFQAPISTNSGANLSLVAAVDLNGDGNADVVGVFNHSLLVYLNKGDGTFFPGVAYSLGANYPTTITLSDFNGDGKIDVALVYSDGTGHVLVFLGNGDGTFQSPRNSAFVSNQSPYMAVAGDFNGDGKVDLVVSFYDFEVEIQLGNGDGTFQPPTEITATTQEGTLAVADLNGDGRLDLVIGPDLVEIYLGNGDGTFSTAHSYQPTLPEVDHVRGPVIGDFNLDGKPDIAADGSILLGNGDGTFQAWPGVLVPAVPGYAPAVGDFDKNGFPDLAVVSDFLYDPTNYMSIVLNDRTGALYHAGDYVLPQPQTITAVATADVNGDGNLDILVVGPPYPNMGGWYLNVLLGNGDGSFAAPATYSFSSTFASGPIIIADFNNDHKLDIAVQDTASTVAVLLGNGDGTFGSPVEIPDGQPNPYSATTIVCADFNGDGNLDLAVGQNGLAILLGKGDGTFQAATFPSTATFSFLMGGDLNGDGKADLIGGSPTFGGLVQAFLGNGDGTFRALTPWDSGGFIETGAALADIDGDGKLDVIGTQMTGNSSGNIYEGVYLGNGDGTFGPFVNVFTWQLGGRFNRPAFEQVTDMNGDGKPDLILGKNPPAANVFVILNTTKPAPGASFSPASVTFTSQNVGTSSSPMPVILRNSGNAALRVTGVNIGGTNASEFSQNNNCTTLQPKATCAISVIFTPTAPGVANANLTVADNAGTGSQQVVLTGTGVEPFSLGPASGSPTSATVSAGNSAVFNLAISSPTWSGTVNLTCNIAPVATHAPTCTVPGSVTVTAGTAAPFSVTVATTAPGTAGAMSSVNFPPGSRLVVWTMLLFTSGLLFVGNRRRLPSLAAPVIVLAFVAMAGCGGGGGSSSTTTPGTPAGSYTATVKGTSGSASDSTTLTVIVQ